MSQISGVVCTYNRCESLRETVASLTAQRLGEGLTLEIVVIDNNSTDHTPRIVQEAEKASRWPIRYVPEPVQGVAHARNRALESARGEYIAFVDDDALAEPTWAEAIARCFHDTGADLVGGKVEPLWLTERPGWLSDELMGPIMAVDFGPQRKRCAGGETFLTTNCALRRAGIGRYGGFDASLGRRGRRWIGGEDVELCRRWLARGAHVVYEPAAVVKHKVEAARVTPEFYRRWFEDIGYTQAHQLTEKWHYRLSVLPAWRWKTLLAAGAQYASTRGRGDDAGRFRAQLWWLFERSFLRERMDHWLGKRRCRFADAE